MLIFACNLLIHLLS